MTKNVECGICRTCAYKKDVSGDTHISCSFDWDNSKYTPPKASPYGIRSGWYLFPINFDPIWQETPCQEYSINKDESKVSDNYHNPNFIFNEILSMIKK